MTVEWSTVFQIIQTAVLVIGVPIAAFKIGGDLGRSSQSMSSAIKALADEVMELKTEQRAFRSLLTEVAVQKTRLDAQDTQMAVMQREVASLRRGEGFIDKPPVRTI